VSLPAVAVSQTPEERFREYLASRPKPQRYTDQQRELVAHIFARHSHFDTDQLLADLRRATRRVSRATVYRTLSKLVDAGLLRKIEIGSRTVYDHDYGYPWHEHLVCDECGKLTEFTHEGITEAVKGVAATHGFHLTGYDLVVNGTCAACAAATAGKRRYVM
jgi:Fur family transcriptional regulator, ferric uptake regulator